MTLHKVAGKPVGENSDDLRLWLERLEGCPPITATALAHCDNEVHGDEPPTWFYFEGDPAAGVARRRCLACGGVKHVLDSEERWTHPPMTACSTCGQSMFEVGAGFHLDGRGVDWIAIGARCVGCGTIEGITDMVVAAMSIDEASAAI